MQQLIDKFRKVRQEMIDVVDKLPDGKRMIVLWGDWTPKDVLAHVSAWGIHQIDALKQFKKGVEPGRPLDIGVFNKEATLLRKGWEWNKVYKEFLEVGTRLMAEYESLPIKLWKKKIWRKRDITPKEFIKIEIKHYQKEHTPQIETVL